MSFPLDYPYRSKKFNPWLENPPEDTRAEDGGKAVRGIQIVALRMIADTDNVFEEKKTAEGNHCKLPYR